ncbi:DUF5696 domain-containing protein [Paenibacillus durus]|nr:DUF5696 domain-containing protein [Paenibacillus durus]
MAGRYRQHLIEEQGMKPLGNKTSGISFKIDLLGADTKKGFIKDSYETFTTTSQAKEMISQLSSMGASQMRITYKGWQQGGISEFGGALPVDPRIGGDEGMREFAELAHSKGFTVMLDGSIYSYNNNGEDGFRKNRDGLRDLGSYVIDYSGLTIAGPKFMERTILSDLESLKKLGVDGLAFGSGIGQQLNSDYNERSPVSRTESKQIQESIIGQTVSVLGAADVSLANFYALKQAAHVFGLSHEYSFDLFVDETVPFAQIALHGLIPYSSGYANLSDNYNKTLLQAIAYGEVPAYLLTYEPSQKLIGTKSSEESYSTCYKDWSGEIAKQYQRFNEALGDVQNQFIVGMRALQAGVTETTYSGGKRIIVNFNDEPYENNGIHVGPGSFAVTEGREPE